MISVIIACYNGEKYLEDTVKSIVDQDYKSWEIVFVDDCSTDNSFKLMADLRIKYNIPFYKIKFISNSKNEGITITKQRGFQNAEGEYIMSLDTDDWISPNYMIEMVRLLEDSPKFDYVYCDSVYHFPDGKEYRYEQPEFNLIRLIGGNFISYCSLMKKRAFLETGYNLNNRGKWEDYELWLRMARKGHYGKHLALPLFHYRLHDNQSINAGDVKNQDHLFRAYFVTQYPELFPEDWLPKAKQQIERLPDNFMSLTGKDFEEVAKLV